MSSENGRGAPRRCTECGAVGVARDAELCKACRIAEEVGEDAAREYRESVARKGGVASRRARTKGLEPEELGELECAEDAMRWAQKIALALASGRISSSRATALKGLLREWRAAREADLTERKVQQLEERLQDLQSQGAI